MSFINVKIKGMNTVKDYLLKKGLTDEIIKSVFGLRMENGKFTNFSDCPWSLSEYNLLKFKKEKYVSEGTKDALFIPVFSPDNKLVGLSIRRMDEQKHDSWFVEQNVKNKTLYGLNTAIPFILQTNRVFLVEGVYDQIAMRFNGIPNCIALLGTNFSYKHFFMLKCLTDNIIFCLDGDMGGRKGIKMALKKYRGKINFFKVNLSQDPDEAIKKYGIEVITKNIEVIK